MMIREASGRRPAKAKKIDTMLIGAVGTAAVDNEPWQRLAKRIGLTQKFLGELLGKPANTISRQIRGTHGGVPRALKFVILAWEELTPEQQGRILRRMDADEAGRQP